jgi:Ferritin-like
MAPRSRVQWVRPSAPVSSSGSDPRSFGQPVPDAHILGGAPRPGAADEVWSADIRSQSARGVGQAIQAYGLPSVPTAKSATEEALALLETAAEIEQSLMVQYLYAALSVKTDTPAGADARGVIIRVAIEEMGHLLAVQNLRIALGGEPYFSRQDQSPQPDHDPYPFRLQKVGPESLARFTAAEAPDESSFTGPSAAQDRAELATITRAAGMAAGVPLIHRVGLVYMRLFYLFQPDEVPVQPWPEAAQAGLWSATQKYHVNQNDFAADPRAMRQGDVQDWSVGTSEADLKAAIVTSTSAVRQMIFDVSAQGEGAAPAIDSHFQRFRKLYRDVVAGSAGFGIVPLPDSTVESTDAEPAATLSRLIDVRYEMLLLNLQQAFAYERGGADDGLRTKLQGWALTEMRRGVGRLGGNLTTFPRHPGGDPKDAPAAPYYSMPVGSLPTDRAAQWSRLRVLIGLSDALMTALSGVSSLNFSALKTLDADRRAFLDSLPST